MNGNVIAGQLGAGIRVGNTIIDSWELAGNRIAGNVDGSFLAPAALNGVDASGNQFDVPPRASAVSLASDPATAGYVISRSQPTDYVDLYASRRLPSEAPLSLDWTPERPDAAVVATVDVRSCGAVGDGKHNDLDAFDAAIAKLPESGGELYVPAGIYRLQPTDGRDTQPFTCVRHHLLVEGRSNLIIKGAGRESMLKFASADHVGLRLLGCNDILLRDMCLSLATPRPPLRHNRALLDLSACHGATVENVDIDGSAGSGIQVDSSEQVLLTNCGIDGSCTHGVRVVASVQTRIDHCHISDSRDCGVFFGSNGSIDRAPRFDTVDSCLIDGTREGFGIGIASGDHIVITSSTISNTYQAGIAVYVPSGNFTPEHVTISGNRLHSCDNGALSYTRGVISIFSNQPQANITVANNDIDTSMGPAIWADSGALGVLTLFGNVSEGVAQPAVQITDRTRNGTNGLHLR
jgi:hypothetical protein